MRAALLAFALLPSIAFGEHGLWYMRQTPVMTYDEQPPLPSTRHPPHNTGVSLLQSQQRTLPCSPYELRVQYSSNIIEWTYTQGDPPTVDVVITNSDNQTLNGAFSIARGVPVSQEVWLALLSSSQRF